MFSKPIDSKKEADVVNKMKFTFIHEFLGTTRFKGAIFDAHSLASLMATMPREILKQAKAGMKIMEGNKLKDMDDFTFRTLLINGKKINSEMTTDSNQYRKC